jgi:hypothetical protein
MTVNKEDFTAEALRAQSSEWILVRHRGDGEGRVTPPAAPSELRTPNSEPIRPPLFAAFVCWAKQDAAAVGADLRAARR